MRYEIELVPLAEDKLELVRQWRNSKCVRTFMEFQDEITPGMQQEWFESINNKNNSYALIVWQGKAIGLSNIKNIDHATKSGESGIFIADPDYLNTSVPIAASLCGLDYCFEQFGLEVIYGKVADDNIAAKRMNAALGYEPINNTVQGRFKYYRLTKQSYYQHRKQLLDLLYGTE